MRRHLAILTLLAPAIVGAQASGSPPPACCGMEGTAGEVLAWASLLTVERPGRPEARIHVDADTRVTVNGRPATLGEVLPGQAVRIRFDVTGDDPVATEIVAEGP